MDKNNFVELLHKYLKGEATEEEQNFLISYYNLFQNEPDIIALMSDEKKTSVKEEIKDAVLDIIAREDQSARKKRFIKLWSERLLVASVFISICVIGIFLSTYFFKSKASNTVTVFNNKNTERLIHLPDNSTIILGAGSKVHYPASFVNLKKREVHLEGSAFFDVSHNPSQPFIVYSGKLQTTVLGTAFSIEAFPWNRDITVTVKRGKVKVSDSVKTQGIITPNQQIKYNTTKAVSVQKIVDANNYNRWKDAELAFDDVTFADAADVLEKKFNVKIVFSEQQIELKHFTATLNTNEPLDLILRTICEFNEAVYTYDKEKMLFQISSAQNRLKADTN